MSWITKMVQDSLGQMTGTNARQSPESEMETNELSRQASDNNDHHKHDYEQRLKENEQGRIDNIERHNLRLINIKTARTAETRSRTPN